VLVGLPYLNNVCGDDGNRTRVLQRTNNTSISHVYLVFLD